MHHNSFKGKTEWLLLKLNSNTETTGVTHCIRSRMHLIIPVCQGEPPSLSFPPLMCAFWRSLFLLWLCSSWAVWINSDTSEETGRPHGSPWGRACKTPPGEKPGPSEGHYVAVIRIHNAPTAKKKKASGDVCAFYSAVHVHHSLPERHIVDTE